MIFSYNPKYVGDTLMVIVANDKDLKNQVVRKGNIARIQNEEGTIVAWNIFHVSEMIEIKGQGQVQLTTEQIEKLNEALRTAGFTEQLEIDETPKFVVGFVKECDPHEDSDHLSITKIEVDGGEELQIVCGAPNIRRGQKVVVAKVGAMMPDGLVIWPGELRGVESFGMVCSAKELRLENAPKKRGILELPASAIVGETFKF